MKLYKFKLDGSKSKLVIEPDLKSNHNNLINGREKLDITDTRDIKENGIRCS
jgi:hypothetical protein